MTTRAQTLWPVDRNEPVEPIPGMEITDAHREALDMDERRIPGPAGAPDVRVLTYRPKGTEGERLPILLHLHGGGFCIMHPDDFAGMEANWALMHRCQVVSETVSVTNRVAPSHITTPTPPGCRLRAATCRSLPVAQGVHQYRARCRRFPDPSP